MRNVRTDRRIRSAVNFVELLEPRQLLSATMLSAVPAQSVTTGSAGAQINLATFLNDPSITGGTVIEMQTPLGNIPLQLTDSQTPLTVANFVQYINNGEYSPTIIQRVAAAFVIQGGGTKPDGSNNAPLADVTSEAGISNTTGTIAMALSTGPNSGNNQWFINLADNTGLDDTSDGGPFTVFGNVIDSGMTVVNNIGALQTINGGAENSNWSVPTGSATLPVINYTGSATPTTVPAANLVTDTIVKLTGAAAAPSYTATSANTSLVTVQVVNNTLTIVAAAGATSGTTTVTATVTDLSGNTATSTFNVTVVTVPVVSIADASATAGSGSQLVFPVTLSSANSAAVTLSYALTAGTASSADFSATGSSLTIPAGSTTASIAVNIVGNSSNASETFTIALSGLSSGVAFSSGSATEDATGTILPAVITSMVTITTITESAPAFAVGGTDTFIATVTPAVAGVTPTGTVTFNIGDATLGTATLSGNTATLNTTWNTPGNQAVTAVYGGDTNYTTSTSDATMVNVSTLTPEIVAKSMPAAVVTGAATPAAFLVVATNSTASRERGIATFNLFASTDGQVNGNSILIATVKRPVNLVTGAIAVVPFFVRSLQAKLATGAYTLVTQAIDPSGNISNASSGPAVMVAAPFIALSESIVRLTLPSSVVTGTRTPAVALLKVTNAGNIASFGFTTITLYTSPDGTIASGTAFKSIAPRLLIGVGRAIGVLVPLGTVPVVADGDYFIAVQVTDPKGGTSPAASAATVNIAKAHIDFGSTLTAISTEANIGSSVTVRIDLSNGGNIGAAGILKIAFSASLASDGTNPVSLETLSARINLPPNRIEPLFLQVPLPSGMPTGAIFLVATVDPGNVFHDVDLADNTSVSLTSINVT